MPQIIVSLLIASTAPNSAYPVKDMLDAAHGVCEIGLKESYSTAQLEDAEWFKYIPKSGEVIEREIKEAEAFFGTAPMIFVRHINNRQLFAFLHMLKPKGAKIMVCSVQDPIAEIKLNNIGLISAQVIEWANQAPFDNNIDLGEDLEKGFDQLVFKRVWIPGLNTDSSSTTIRYIPAKFSDTNAGLTFTTERIIKEKSQ